MILRDFAANSFINSTRLRSRFKFQRPLFLSRGSHRWQNLQNEPFLHPCCTNAQALHVPRSWPMDPIVGSSADPNSGILVSMFSAFSALSLASSWFVLSSNIHRLTGEASGVEGHGGMMASSCSEAYSKFMAPFGSETIVLVEKCRANQTR